MSRGRTFVWWVCGVAERRLQSQLQQLQQEYDDDEDDNQSLSDANGKYSGNQVPEPLSSEVLRIAKRAGQSHIRTST
jgi:hypothetical protein